MESVSTSTLVRGGGVAGLGFTWCLGPGRINAGAMAWVGVGVVVVDVGAMLAIHWRSPISIALISFRAIVHELWWGRKYPWR